MTQETSYVRNRAQILTFRRNHGFTTSAYILFLRPFISGNISSPEEERWGGWLRLGNQAPEAGGTLRQGPGGTRRADDSPPPLKN